MVSLGVIAELSATVPAEAFFILVTKEAFAEAPAPLNLTPTWTTLIVSSEAKAAGVSSMFTSSICSFVLEEIKVVALSGVTSSMSVLSPVQAELSPVALGLR